MGIKSGNYRVISRATYNLGSNLHLDVKNMGVSWNFAPQIRLIIISPHFPHKKMNPCELNQVKSTIFRHPKVSKGWTPHLPCFGHPFGAMGAPWASGSYARERWEPAQCPCDRPRCDLGMGYLGLEKRLVSGQIFELSWVSGSPFFVFTLEIKLESFFWGSKSFMALWHPARRSSHFPDTPRCRPTMQRLGGETGYDVVGVFCWCVSSSTAVHCLGYAYMHICNIYI